MKSLIKLRSMVVAVALLVGLASVLAWGVAQDRNSAESVEVRITAQRLESGVVEFALQRREDGVWGDRLLPRARMFPTSAAVNRWLSSSPLQLEVEGTGQPPGMPRPLDFTQDPEQVRNWTPPEDDTSVWSLPRGWDWERLSGYVLEDRRHEYRRYCSDIQTVDWSVSDDWDERPSQASSTTANKVGMWVAAFHGYDICETLQLEPIDVSQLPQLPDDLWVSASTQRGSFCRLDDDFDAILFPSLEFIDLGFNQLQLTHSICGSFTVSRPSTYETLTGIGSEIDELQFLPGRYRIEAEVKWNVSEYGGDSYNFVIWLYDDEGVGRLIANEVASSGVGATTFVVSDDVEGALSPGRVSLSVIAANESQHVIRITKLEE